jgi:sialidase-1
MNLFSILVFVFVFGLTVRVTCLSTNPVDLFIAGSVAGVNNFRIPALVRTQSGVLLAFAEARSENSDCAFKWTVFRQSFDNGTTWGSITNLYKPTNKDETAGNPAVVYDSVNKKTLVIIAIGDSKHCNPTRWTLVFSSLDDGNTWEVPLNISSQLGQWAGALPGPGTAAQILSGKYTGRIVVPAHNGAYSNDVAYYSDDGGKTWTVGTTELPRMDEAVIAVQRNGSLLLNMRNDHANTCDCRAIIRSDDGGETFNLPILYDSTLISPVCQASLVTIEGSMYFSNPASKTSRVNITIRRSDNDGSSWNSQTFLAGPGGSDGYSCLAAGDASAVDPTSGIKYGSILYENENAKGELTISWRLFPLDLSS